MSDRADLSATMLAVLRLVDDSGQPRTCAEVGRKARARYGMQPGLVHGRLVTLLRLGLVTRVRRSEQDPWRYVCTPAGSARARTRRDQVPVEG